MSITTQNSENKPKLEILLAAPRGFCAGVDRAIQIVELALKKYGAPVYVRHEIVHNKYVVNSLKERGAVFVEELDEIPDGDVPVIFSAHGVPKSVPEAAKFRNMLYLDATCPLVSKVHNEAERHHKNGLEVVLIGHAGHPEVIGTMGQLPEGKVTLLETEADVEAFEPLDPSMLAYITQTTLSVDDTRQMIDLLHEKFPDIKGPNREDICYATTNRQMAVKEIAQNCDAFIVVGAPNSSNSMRLVEVAKRNGCSRSFLLERADELDWDHLDQINVLGISAGASAPEKLVEEVIEAFSSRYQVETKSIVTAQEDISFKLPRQLVQETKLGQAD